MPDIGVTEPSENSDLPCRDENFLFPRIEDSQMLNQSYEDPNPGSVDEPLMPQVNDLEDWLSGESLLSSFDQSDFPLEIELSGQFVACMQNLHSFEPDSPFGEGIS